ncbi:hypothetical protein SEA_PHELPSODU_60 [Mycobacterium phage PhelpsODU]|uniref:Uncharacterized protein n=1 Tax=Mycobacterium phage Unicorn TaxID=2015825 RepID=A0A222ZLM2_9CAUD|nr:hypothetical protein I5G78_gp046 [Mycobacterium phage Unicorn]ASR85071.1 hypothetical protein SEA_UNICORN_60 [Mycobacterium phage Unicorn]ASR85170.1 hypothetical protein SEA_PHELPSODU_60 [Mycobacterium phage PhelpsODU]
MSATAKALALIVEERKRQEAKWGEQDHPNVDRIVLEYGEAPTQNSMARFYEVPTALRAKFRTGQAAAAGECTWAHILIEEVAEAIEAATVHDLALLTPEQTLAELRSELVQIAAVAVAWIENLDGKAGVSN